MLLLKTKVIIFECSIEFNFLSFSLSYHTVIELEEFFGKVTYTELLPFFSFKFKIKIKTKLIAQFSDFSNLFAFLKFTVYVFGGHFSFAFMESRTIDRITLLRNKKDFKFSFIDEPDLF